MRDLTQIKNYKPLAASIHRSGIYTLDELTSYMNEVDWIGKQAAEIKKDYLGLYGMVTVMERDYYVKWHITWKFSYGIIVRAARESAGAANATFKYIDSILERWRDLGVDTLEACEEAIRLWNEEKKTIKVISGQRPGRINRRQPEKERDVSPWNDVLEGDE
jgi:DnaD/phage-associated family protein